MNIREVGDHPVDLGVGIVGAGLMGRKWSEVAAKLAPGAHLVAVTGGRRAPGLATDYGCPCYESMEELLADPRIDIIVLASPPAVHAEQTVAAAAAGKHLLVEKPMANDVEQCRRMIEACARADVRLAVVSPHRFKAGTRLAKQFVDDGAIGHITMVQASGLEVGFWDTSVTQDEWKLDPKQQTTYASWGAHACDLMRWFVGAEADVAFATFEQYGTQPPPFSSAMVSYRFTNATMAQVWMSYDIPPPGHGSPLHLFFVGTQGMVDLDCYGRVRVGANGRLRFGARDGWHTVFETPPVDPLDNPMYQLAAQFRDLLDSIRNHREPMVDGTEGLATTAMLQAAEISATTGRSVRLPLP